jgi:ribosomal protein S18 acetylase RimI-like enzyme
VKKELDVINFEEVFQLKLKLQNNKIALIRRYQESDFNRIQELNAEEGWLNLVKENENTKEAWRNSNVSYVVESEVDGVVGYIRGLTDTRITLYVCELIIDKKFRGFGIGKELLHYVHSLYPQTRIEMLASSTSQTFYEAQGYRAFFGFRKTFLE